MTRQPPCDAEQEGGGTLVPHWRLLLGGTVVAVAVVVLAVTWRADIPPQEGLGGGAAPSPPASPEATKPDDLQAASEEELVLAAAVAALDAWAAFAATGDTTRLAGHFDPEGPQYQQLVDEAPDIAADGSTYAFTLAAATVTRVTDADRAVRGRVTFTRDGEPVGEYRWELQLRRGNNDDAWRLWTVNTH